MKIRQLFRSYLWGMAGKKKEAKKPLKTMEELTKNFEEFEKKHGKEGTGRETFEQALKKAATKK